MEGKRVMILGAGEAQVPVIKECKELNLFTIVVDFDENALGFEYADEKLVISTLDEDEILRAAKKYKINGILTTSDNPVKVVANVALELNLPGPSRQTAILCTNKYLFRNFLKNNNISVPLFTKLNSKSRWDLNNFNFPLVIKPVDSSASRGVVKVNNLSELKSAFVESIAYSSVSEVIVESFLEGVEYSVEALTQNGKTDIIAITEKRTTGFDGKYFVEESHVLPANLKIKDEVRIKNEVLRAIDVIGLDNSASHTELILTKENLIIIEIGARLGGDYITSDLVPMATGVNMLRNIIFISLGIPIDCKSLHNRYSGIQFINSDNYEVMRNHLNRIKMMPQFVRSEIKEFREIELKNSFDRLGYVICVAETKEQLNKILV